MYAIHRGLSEIVHTQILKHHRFDHTGLRTKGNVSQWLHTFIYLFFKSMVLRGEMKEKSKIHASGIRKIEK